jgi:hypothetical protein
VVPEEEEEEQEIEETIICVRTMQGKRFVVFSKIFRSGKDIILKRSFTE